MSLTLGEKLRQAREERGFTLAEVSEQTRISSLYLESIENDDYRILPGGIFNKGFVKSFAKFVGINEQEALADYASNLALSEIAAEPELKLYRPEVLTDDRSAASMAPTIILAVVILGLMTGGILFLISYLRQPADPTPPTNTARTNTNSQPDVPANTATTSPAGVPDMATLKVEFRVLNQPMRLIATTDGTKSDAVVAAGSAATFEPKESLTLDYNRWNAANAALTINGKTITLPSEPLPGSTNKQRIQFTISKDNLTQIWTSGSISTEVPAVPTDANTVAPDANAAPTSTPVRPTTPRPTPAANTATTPAANTRPADTPRPATPRPSPTRQ